MTDSEVLKIMKRCSKLYPAVSMVYDPIIKELLVAGITEDATMAIYGTTKDGDISHFLTYNAYYLNLKEA